MTFIKLTPPCPTSSPIIAAADPDPRWTLTALLSDLKSIESLIATSSPTPPSLAGPRPTDSFIKRSSDADIGEPDHQDGSGGEAFVMRVTDGDFEELEQRKPWVMRISEDGEETESEEEVGGMRFSGNDIELSDDEEGEDGRRTPTRMDLMARKSVEEGILFEMEFEHRLKMKEQLRTTFSALEASQQNENGSAVFQIERFTQSRREMDRRLDKQYQLKVAEVLDKHLSVIQRNHKKRSQIEELRLRDDAALEEAKRKEQRLQEEKVRQEKAKAEEEARLKAIKIAEEKKAAQEAEERALKAAAEKEAAIAAAEVALKESLEHQKVADREKLGVSLPKVGQLQGIRVMATDAALKAEITRLKSYDEVEEKYLTVAQDLGRYARKINMLVGQISGNLENVRAKATSLMNIFKNPECPQPISILIFAKKVVCLCDNPTGSIDAIAFACGHVILLLASQVPTVMEFVLAELHKACIYTVPKHLHPSHPTVNNKDFFKTVGYREENGKLESSDSYLNRVSSYIKLYAALVQTESDGIRNPHGLKEGWAWLARFLNSLPANRTTAFALEAFLKMAGFALHRRYGRQFEKIMNVIRGKYLPSLKERDPGAGEIIMGIEKFLQLETYEKEPEGRRLRNYLFSKEFEA